MIKRLGVLVCILVVASCARSGPAGPSPRDDRFGAPLPSAPRDVRAASADPCALLTARQWQALGFVPDGDPVVLPTGERSCEWRATDRQPYVNVGIAAQRDILVDTYRVRQFAVFTPTMIGGLPATTEQTAPGSISCNVTVGTARGQGFLVIYDGQLGANGQPEDSCAEGRAVAERIVAALPPLPG